MSKLFLLKDLFFRVKILLFMALPFKNKFSFYDLHTDTVNKS